MDVIFQNETVCNFLFKEKRSPFFSVKREMPILFFVNCERTVLFSVKRDQDPPFTTLLNAQQEKKNEARKAKKEGRREILLSAHAQTSEANILHLDQKAAKCTTCKQLCSKF